MAGQQRLALTATGYQHVRPETRGISKKKKKQEDPDDNRKEPSTEKTNEQTEETRNKEDREELAELEELRIWSLNVRSIANEGKLKELEQESKLCPRGILLLQETWRRDPAERLDIGEWIFYGTGNANKPKGNGTGILIHKSIQVESWHFITSRLTAIRIKRRNKHIMLVSAYAPVQTTGACSQRTIQFYDKLSAITKEAQQRGDWVIIGGDMNTSIKTENAPGLIGRWASNKVSANSEAMVNFMMEHQMAALNTFQQTQWRRRYTWSRGLSKTMIDFFWAPST